MEYQDTMKYTEMAKEQSKRMHGFWAYTFPAHHEMILRYLEDNKQRPITTAVLTSLVFTALINRADLLNLSGKLNADEFFYCTMDYFERFWNLNDTIVRSSTDILVEMGWLDKKLDHGYNKDEKRPATRVLYKLNMKEIDRQITERLSVW